MASTVCDICGNKIFIKKKAKDGVVCVPCMNTIPMKYFDKSESLTVAEIKAMIPKPEPKPSGSIFTGGIGIKRPEPVKAVSSADEIRKFKALLDDGIITPEEFEEKKKKLLE